MAAWEQFATSVLGLAVSEHADDGSLYLRMDEYHHRFLVHPTGKDDLAYIGWEVADEHALHALADQLGAAGVEVTQGTPEERAVRRVAYRAGRTGRTGPCGPATTSISCGA